jgi:hypothetical protein
MYRLLWLVLLGLLLTGSVLAQETRPREAMRGVASCWGLLGDMNLDGQVNVLDFAILAKSYDKSPGEPGWDARADLNRDGRVDDLDWEHLRLEYGR